MFNIRRFVFSLLSTHFPGLTPNHDHIQDSKSIAIIGAGSAGLAMLKTLLDLPEETRKHWDIVLYEQREEVAGVWLPQPKPAVPPQIPETPLYPLLHTNTPVPSMAYPGFPFPPGTPLYPSHEHIEAYHKRYASHYNLTSHIKFNHKVLSTRWLGTSEEGHWDISIQDHRNGTIHERSNHLVIASGNHHIPRIPVWKGQSEWLDSGHLRTPKREILHSVYYREPEKYIDRTLLIVGSGASGQDAAIQTVRLSRRTYLSARHEVNLPSEAKGVVLTPEISHFTADSIVFIDGSEVRDVDSVLLGTGYEQRKPFLDEGHTIITDPSITSNSSGTASLFTNLRYIFPLHRHIFSLCPNYPLNALAFIGLPTAIANCPSDIAQSLFVTHIILKPDIVPSRAELLSELAAQEEAVRREGFDPYNIGHRMRNGTSSDYQDELVDFLKHKKVIPNDKQKFVESWRRDIFNYPYLKRGWKRIEELGLVEQWVGGVETEEQWADLMQRINAWQEDWERQNGITFSRDLILGG